MVNKLEDVLGIDAVDITPKKQLAVIEEKPVPEEPKPEGLLEPDAREDYVLSRETFRSLINKGNDAIDGINDLARISESPRAYEVLATLMKTVAETTKDLYDLQKKTKDLKGASLPTKRLDETAITVEKAVFVGTTAELLKKVKSEDEK